MTQPKNPYRESSFGIADAWQRVKSFLVGYAIHPTCRETIYRPFANFSPGRCSRCGSRMNDPCMGSVKSEITENEYEKGI